MPGYFLFSELLIYSNAANFGIVHHTGKLNNNLAAGVGCRAKNFIICFII